MSRNGETCTAGTIQGFEVGHRIRCDLGPQATAAVVSTYPVYAAPPPVPYSLVVWGYLQAQ